jgi:hypothetical protein
MRQGRDAGVPVGHISGYFQKPEVPFPKIVRRLMRWLLLDNPLKALIFDRLRTLD